MANAQVRRLDQEHWLHVDDSSGFSILDHEDVVGLDMVTEESHVPLGYDSRGDVIEV